MTTKTIRFIKAWRLHPVGAIVAPEASVADLLIQQGRAVEVAPEADGKPAAKPAKPENRKK